MGDHLIKIAVRESTRERLKECKREFIEHHPEMEHVFISNDKIVHEIAKYYLKKEA